MEQYRRVMRQARRLGKMTVPGNKEISMRKDKRMTTTTRRWMIVEKRNSSWGGESDNVLQRRVCNEV